MPELRAPAKLTLSLRVTGVRADGYHELDAIMVTVSEPSDFVSIEPADATSLVVTGPAAQGVPTDASNLAWRAAEFAGTPVEIAIEKHIPHGGGLGGGSADAAAVLRALGVRPDVDFGASLGADIPFCVHGGPARVRGIGEVVESIELPVQFTVIATPRFGCATADVYRAWDALGGPHAEPNDLEPAAFEVEPRLRAFKSEIETAAGAPARLAGSGSSYAVLFDDESAASAAYERVESAVDGSVWLGRT
jgi:4-diphosphocytidyl-2-C-methyl-D-erythritol kinase